MSNIIKYQLCSVVSHITNTHPRRVSVSDRIADTSLNFTQNRIGEKIASIEHY